MEKSVQQLEEYEKLILPYISKAEDSMKVLEQNSIPELLKIVKITAKCVGLDFKRFREQLVRIMTLLVKFRSESSVRNYEILMEEGLLKIFVGVTIQINRKWVTLRTIFRDFGILINSLDGSFLKKIAFANAKYLGFLEKSLATAGEYRNQRVVMLLILDLMKEMSQEEVSSFAREMFHTEELSSLREFLESVDLNHPEKSIRDFLNAYNDSLEDREIVTLEVTSLSFGNLPGAPIESDKFWVDFNSSPLCITFFCSSKTFAEQFLDDQLFLIYIPVKIINKFSCKRKGRKYELSLSTSEKITVVDVTSGKVDDFYEITELSCRFNISQLDKPDVKGALKKIHKIVQKSAAELRKQKEAQALATEKCLSYIENSIHDLTVVGPEQEEAEEQVHEEPERIISTPNVESVPSLPSPIRPPSVEPKQFQNPRDEEEEVKKENSPESDSGICFKSERRTNQRILSSSSSEDPLPNSQASSVWIPAFTGLKPLKASKENDGNDVIFVDEAQNEQNPHKVFEFNEDIPKEDDFLSLTKLKDFGKEKNNNEVTSTTIKETPKNPPKRKFFKNTDVPLPGEVEAASAKKRKTAGRKPRAPAKKPQTKSATPTKAPTLKALMKVNKEFNLGGKKARK